MRRLARAQESMIYHIKSLITRRRQELTIESVALPKGEKIRPPADLLGAMVASNLEHERNKDGQGLTAEELVGNVCELSHDLAGHIKAQAAD